MGNLASDMCVARAPARSQFKRRAWDEHFDAWIEFWRRSTNMSGNVTFPDLASSAAYYATIFLQVGELGLKRICKTKSGSRHLKTVGW
jgi:hypothetical protein